VLEGRRLYYRVKNVNVDYCTTLSFWALFRALLFAVCLRIFRGLGSLSERLLLKKTGQWIISKNSIISLIYDRHKLSDRQFYRVRFCRHLADILSFRHGRLMNADSVRFEGLTGGGGTMKITVFWDVTQSSVVNLKMQEAHFSEKQLPDCTSRKTVIFKLCKI
jgi:hypothetical protein